MTVWVCQVRREVFVGGESQRCRHPAFTVATGFGVVGSCGAMELIGGEPIQWCVEHGSANVSRWYCESSIRQQTEHGQVTPCKFVSQIRVGP